VGTIGNVYISADYGTAISFFAMNILAVWLALRGNRMLLNDIQNRSLNSEGVLEERATASLQQQKQIMYGIVYRLSFYFTISMLDFNSFFSFRMLPVQLLIDTLALVLLLGTTLLFGVRKNELYSQDKFDFKLAYVTPARRPKRQAISTEYSDWNPFNEKKDAHVKEAKIEQRCNERIRIEQKHIEDERKKIVQGAKEHQMRASKQRLEDEDFLTEDTWDIFVPQGEEQAESAAK